MRVLFFSFSFFLFLFITMLFVGMSIRQLWIGFGADWTICAST